MIRLSASWLTDPASTELCAALTDAGHACYFVGGCVRNALLAQPVSDLDIATDARPEQVIAAAQVAGLNTIPTGIDHGTITVVARGRPFEVTTFRRDVETDGRHAVIAYSDRMEDDAARRDFTMNALYARPDGTVLDPINGLPDLEAGRLRFIGDANARVAEDYLRILRFFRFLAWYGDPLQGVDADGLAACAAGVDGLAQVSVERITQEILKLLAAPDPSRGVVAMAQSGVLAAVLPGAVEKSLPVLVHLEQKQNVGPSALRRLACLGQPSADARLRLRKRDQRGLQDRLEALAAQTPVAELAYRKGRDLAMDVALIWAALMEQTPSANLEAQLELGASAVFPVKAADLMPAFQGPKLGAELERLKVEWIASGFSLGRSELLAP